MQTLDEIAYKLFLDTLSEDDKSAFYQAPLLFALKKNAHSDVIKILIQNVKSEAELEILDDQKRTILIIAVIKKKYDVVKLLLQTKISVDHCDCEGNNALDYALEFEDLCIIKLIVNAGASLIKETDKESYLTHTLVKLDKAILEEAENGSEFEVSGYYKELVELFSGEKGKYTRLVSPKFKVTPLVFAIEGGYAMHSLIPTLIKMGASKEELEMYHITKRVGHVLGLDSNFNIQGKTFESTSGYPEKNLQILHHKLKKHVASDTFSSILPKEIFQQLLQTFDFHDNCYSMESGKRFSEGDEITLLFENYQAGKLTLLLTGWQNHWCAIVLHKNKLIYINRGIGAEKNPGCHIYSLKETLAEEDIYDFTGNLPGVSQEKFFKKLMEFVDIDNPIATLQGKTHKHDTCSMANIKFAINAMLYCLAEDLLGSDKIDNKILNGIRSDYKLFTKFMRDDEISFILDKTEQKHSDEQRQLYEGLIRSILIEHHDAPQAPSKDFIPLFVTVKQFELDRAKRLWNGLPTTYKKSLSEDKVILELINRFEKTSTESEKFTG